MRELFEKKIQENDFPEELRNTKLPEGNKLTFKECFKVFDVIFQLTSDPKVVERIAKEMIEDHCIENVRYLEIRSTPKNLTENFQKRDYITCILNCIKEGKKICDEKYGWSPIVKYIVSVARSESKEEVLIFFFQTRYKRPKFDRLKRQLTLQ